MILFLFLLILIFTGKGAAADRNYISVNCGAGEDSTAVSGRNWIRDDAGSKASSTAEGDPVDPVPYNTARISRSQFSYSFRLNPGQKFIRLHFNPASYHGFQRFNDFFTVEAGSFTLLANFSASITSRALGVKTLAKEFLLIVHENETLGIVFSPQSESGSNSYYAFINGIEIISVPSTLSYFHGGVGVVGHNSVIYVDDNTALERAHRQHIKWDSLSPGDDIGGMFRMWASTPKENSNHKTWGVWVDVGFRYLVRLRLCEVGLEMGFELLINNVTALTSVDVLQQRENQSILWYNYYAVMVEGGNREDKKRQISISLRSQHEFFDRHGPLEGFEVFKLSNHDRSLATPNPLPPRPVSLSQTIRTLLHRLHLPRADSLALAFTVICCLANIIAHLLFNILVANFNEEEENKLSSGAMGLFSFLLVKIQPALLNFLTFVLGEGAYRKVYTGIIDNRREMVATKRFKPDAKQEEHRLRTQVEMPSQLQHVNLVYEPQEIMLVCILAGRPSKPPGRSIDFYPFSWKQLLKICAGAGRALDYHRIIHRDLKVSNILLDENFVAKVSDFGLAKSINWSKSQSQESTNYFQTRKLTKRNDVYSFGVVLLEILYGRYGRYGRPAMATWDEEDERRLTMWAIEYISEGKIDHIVALSLRGEISPDNLNTFVKVAETCLYDEPKKGPATAHIVIKLELALQQQEKAASWAPKERTSVEDVFSFTDEARNQKILVPNEKINVADDARPSPGGRMLPQTYFRNFTVSELKAATKNFRSYTFLGSQGGFGKVYKGWLDEKCSVKAGSGTPIAAKKFNSESMQGFQEWLSEVNILGRLCHPNLVYEFMSNGSLENHLFGRSAHVELLPWDIRVKIMTKVARGLAFLHASDKQVIHRDIKPSNILLDGLSDFGLAKMGPTYCGCHVNLDPENFVTGHLYEKSDIHSLGVVLLELLRGPRILDTCHPAGQQNLVEWIKQHVSKRRRKKKLKHIIDVCLAGQYPSKSAVQIAKLALNCLEIEPMSRPSMQEIVERLARIVSVNLSPTIPAEFVSAGTQCD